MVDTWRVLEDPVGAGPSPAAAPAEACAGSAPRPTWLLLAAGTVMAVVAAVWLVFSGPSGSAVAVNAAHGLTAPTASGASATASIGGSARTGDDPQQLVIEVNGAVRLPGIYRVVPGSRVGDAIAAAGGYGGRVDAIAAQSLNLAAKVEDGQQVHVPARGEALGGGSSTATSGASGGATGGASAHQPAGPINVNTASATELDSLPGIGPATAAKIMAARATRPFESVDALGERKVVGAATLEKIRDLVVTR